MLIGARPFRRPYGFITDASAARFMDGIAGRITIDPAAQASPGRPDVTVKSDLKARVKSTGRVAIKSLDWSVRCPDPGVFGGLRARTLLAWPERMHWIDLPDDPALPALASLANQKGQWQMLRYVPLRRATLLHHSRDRAPHIVKVKRPDRAREAGFRPLAAQAALGASPGFGMPHLQALDAAGCLRISLCPGTPLSGGFPADLRATLRRIGDLHARLHDALSLVDFDLCHAGDAAADIARFLVSLPDDLAANADRAVCQEAYLQGYHDRRVLPDAETLRWHRAQAVAKRLLVYLRKDQANPSRIDRLVAQIESVPA